MDNQNVIGQIKILEIVDHPDGTCTITYDVPDTLKEFFKNHFGWDRWSAKKFNEYFLEELTKNAKNMERESGSGTSSDQRSVDVFDNKYI